MAKKTRTPDPLAGMKCPECGHTGSFDIEVPGWSRFGDNGAEPAGGERDLTWDRESPCCCPECSHEGKAHDFTEKPAPPSLKFACPECGHDALEEVVAVDMMVNPISRLDPGGDHDYGGTDSEEGEGVQCYRCAKCGWEIEDGEGIRIDDCVSLAEWLKTRTCNRVRETGPEGG